jgi:hypothetical protein
MESENATTKADDAGELTLSKQLERLAWEQAAMRKRIEESAGEKRRLIESFQTRLQAMEDARAKGKKLRKKLGQYWARGAAAAAEATLDAVTRGTTLAELLPWLRAVRRLRTIGGPLPECRPSATCPAPAAAPATEQAAEENAD